MIPSNLLFNSKPSLSIWFSTFPIMRQQFQFQPPFDSMAYQILKKENSPSDKIPAGAIEPNHSKHDTSKSTTGTSGTVTANVSEEFPPIETLLPIDVYDLTAEDESLVPLPKPSCQQATQTIEGQSTQEQPTPNQGQPTQGQSTQATEGQTTQEQAQATQEIKDGNIQGTALFP